MIEFLYKLKIIVFIFFCRVIVINIIYNKFCYICIWWIDMVIFLEKNVCVWMNSIFNVFKNRDILV